MPCHFSHPGVFQKHFFLGSPHLLRRSKLETMNYVTGCGAYLTAFSPRSLPEIEREQMLERDVAPA